MVKKSNIKDKMSQCPDPATLLPSYKEGPEGVKWELGLAGFALEKWGLNHTGTGIWSLGMGKNVTNKKWEWNLRIVKWDLEKNVKIQKWEWNLRIVKWDLEKKMN